MKFSIFLKVCLLLVSTNVFAQTSVQSPLQNHPSEYLAMHASDPVHWQLWNDKTLLKSKNNDKLILVSSGYFSCHWCHVTQKELYQDSAVAQQLNKLFINIKVDRELTPEIDRQMIDFAKRAIGSAGWPQHVIFTPSGLPFAGFTYLPKQQLLNYLRTLENVWQTNRAQIEQLAQQFQQLATDTVRSDAQTLSNTAILHSIANNLDDFSGGLKGSHKFPNSPLLISLLAQQTLPADIKDWLKFTLQQMQSQHLQDHIYGGFYRYTVDPEWQTPHFEKMLYDNAQLLEVFALAAQKWPNLGFAKTAENTLHYLQEHLYDRNLQLYLGSQSALDQAGQEGGDYLWSQPDLQKALTSKHYAMVEEQWQLQQPAPYDLGWHPKPTSTDWQSIQRTLKQRASSRSIPTDSKAIIAWNALLLKALIQSEQLAKSLPAGKYPYLQKAKQFKIQLANRLAKLYQQPSIPRAAVWQNKKIQALGKATLEGLAYASQAFQRLTQNQSKPLWNQTYQNLLAQQKNFLTDNGWKFTQNSTKKIWHIADNELPSPTHLLNCYQKQIRPLTNLPAGKQAWQFATTLTSCKP